MLTQKYLRAKPSFYFQEAREENINDGKTNFVAKKFPHDI